MNVFMCKGAKVGCSEKPDLRTLALKMKNTIWISSPIPRQRGKPHLQIGDNLPRCREGKRVNNNVFSPNYFIEAIPPLLWRGLGGGFSRQVSPPDTACTGQALRLRHLPSLLRYATAGGERAPTPPPLEACAFAKATAHKDDGRRRRLLAAGLS